jgi:glycogen debranching enzyme
MSKEQFNADPTIEDIDAAIDALEHLIDKAELIERLEAAKENLDREFKTEEVPLYYGGINDGIDKAITIIKELGE